jgi:hypothetical protein
MLRSLFLLLILFSSLLAHTVSDEGEDGMKNFHEAIQDLSDDQLYEYFKKDIKNLLKPSSIPKFNIGGEVISLWRWTDETLGSQNLRGKSSPLKRGRNQFIVDFSLLLDFHVKSNWVLAKLEFNDIAGTMGGESDQISLERALLIHRFLDYEQMDATVYLGRRRLYEFYDSELEFSSLSDGLTFAFGYAMRDKTNFVVDTGIYVVNSKVNQYLWIFEGSLINLRNTGLYFTYSLADWTHQDSDEDRIKNNPKWKFLDSQFILGYRFKNIVFNTPAKVCVAFLVNHKAPQTTLTNGRTENLAWYANIRIGEIVKKYDMSGEVMWQTVQAQAVPDFDISGIGHGNAMGSSFFNSSSRAFANGEGNYNGWSLSFLFALTENTTLKSSFVRALPYEKSIGQKFSYSRFQINAIYTF